MTIVVVKNSAINNVLEKFGLRDLFCNITSGFAVDKTEMLDKVLRFSKQALGAYFKVIKGMGAYLGWALN